MPFVPFAIRVHPHTSEDDGSVRTPRITSRRVLRVGLDFDGTIADTNSVKSKWILDNLGRHIPAYSCDRSSLVPMIGEADYTTMCRRVYSAEMTSRLRSVSGLSAALKEMSAYSEFFLITARGGSFRFARDWLSSRGFLGRIRLPELAAGGKSKIEACRALAIDLLVDDDTRHMPIEPNGPIHGILFKPGAPKTYTSENLTICRSWREVMKHANALWRQLLLPENSNGFAKHLENQESYK
jgi:uncharacterized HAD superfamily protein